MVLDRLPNMRPDADVHDVHISDLSLRALPATRALRLSARLAYAADGRSRPRSRGVYHALTAAVGCVRPESLSVTAGMTLSAMYWMRSEPDSIDSPGNCAQ
jgi:hypothetical protein